MTLLLLACTEPTYYVPPERGNTPAASTEDEEEALSQLEMSWTPLDPHSPMALIQGGTVTLGCTEGQIDCTDREVMYDVTLTNDFWLGKTEVTEAFWSEVTGEPLGDCPDCPVSDMSWHVAVDFLNAVSRMEGLEECYGCEYFEETGAFCYEIMDPYTCDGYRLPTEAEWEFGARCGEDWVFSGSNDVDQVAWVDENSGERMPTAQLEPNACGLYDMSGNMWEWGHDWYAEERTSSYVDPYGPPGGSERVARGGAYDFLGLLARVSFRDRCRRPEMHFPNQGFRLARTAR